ncbi:hypothetical protein [Mesorhizobium sp. 1B3]|uniref:hypothetical protein n=1 Tax=Mesorhizobium sp. 1B3 TaxID=3243599 RepID=UPI003D95F993
MRSTPHRSTIFTLALLGCGAMMSGQASADSRYRDRVSADSFGNLVVYSAAGYKRIVVGEGHRARELAAYTGGPKIVHFEDPEPTVVYRDCPAVLLKGRSYMYGLPDHVVPQPSLDFCD